MADLKECVPHIPDYENYYYFVINLITHTVPEPTPAAYLQELSKRVPEIEYLGPLVDAVQIRVKKSDEIDLLKLISGFENINGVASAKLQQLADSSIRQKMFSNEILINIISSVFEEIKNEEDKNFNIRLVNRKFFYISTKILFSNAFAYIKAEKLLCLYIYNTHFEEFFKSMALLIFKIESGMRFDYFYHMLEGINRLYDCNFLIGLLKHLTFEQFIKAVYLGIQEANNYEKYSEIVKLLLSHIGNLKSIDLTINDFQIFSNLNIFNDKEFVYHFASSIASVKLSKYWDGVPNISNLFEIANIEEVRKFRFTFK